MTPFNKWVRQSGTICKDFLKKSALGVASLSLLRSRSNTLKESAGTIANTENGKWVPSPCWTDCGGRCPNYVYVVDGVVVRQKSYDLHPDSPDYPQRRACLRGRSMRKKVFGADRIKYPMKRKNWSPENPKGHLRGKDEWKRISWDEALDIIASELIRAKEKYGNESILYNGMSLVMNQFYKSNFVDCLRAFGGYSGVADSASHGTYKYCSYMLGLPNFDKGHANCRFDMRKADTIVLYGCNPAWSSLGNQTHSFWDAKEAGAEFIFVGPSYNNSAALLEAKWIRVRPATDRAFLLAVAYSMLAEDNPVSNPIIDWDFLDRCTVGFDADHMPEAAKVDENFKDYVLGKYDDIPKTPEWATQICGTPVEDIKWFARKIRKDNKVNLLHNYAPARANDAEDFPQLFMTIGAMGGHYGLSGHATGAAFHCYAGDDTGFPLIKAGMSGWKPPENPIRKEVSSPELFDAIITGKARLDYWNEILSGKYKSGKRWVGIPPEMDGNANFDIHVIAGCFRNVIQTVQDSMKGIEAYRKVDFVFDMDYNFNATAQYSDIVLPLVTEWEKLATHYYHEPTRENITIHSQVIEPMYEAKSAQWIGEQLCPRLGLDPEKVYPLSEAQKYFNYITTTQVINDDGTEYVTLADVSESDIIWWKQKYEVTGKVQKGLVPLSKLMIDGAYQVKRYKGDPYTSIAYKEFREDPISNPLTGSESGKLEIYCQAKADVLNAISTTTGRGKPVYKGYATYSATLNGYESEKRKEYPYQLTTPHYYRRSHSCFDNLAWLREAAPNPVFINTSDGKEKGIKDGDTVLVYNEAGKVLRRASLSERLMPGYIELPHGAWMKIDENSGIDSNGADNVLQPTGSSVSGVSGYNTCLVNFEKYKGKSLRSDCLELPVAPELT